MRKGVAIELTYKHDHIEDAVLRYSGYGCDTFLKAIVEDGVEAYVQITFTGAKCVRSAATDCAPGIGIRPKNLGKSFLVELTESSWPEDAHKAYTYVGSNLPVRGRHFVIINHDVFHEILADSFTERLVTAADPDFINVRSYFING